MADTDKLKQEIYEDLKDNALLLYSASYEQLESNFDEKMEQVVVALDKKIKNYMLESRVEEINKLVDKKLEPLLVLLDDLITKIDHKNNNVYE